MAVMTPVRPRTFRPLDIVVLGALLILIAERSLPALVAFAQDASPAPREDLDFAFTFQGRLVEDGVPVDGPRNFTFKLWDSAQGGSTLGPTITANGLVVTNGVFSARLDFGEEFNGQKRWVETMVDGVSIGRTELTATPHALFASYSNGAQSANVASLALNAVQAQSVLWSGVTARPIGFADDVDNDLLASLACANGEVAKFVSGAWACGTDNATNVTAGTGILVGESQVSLDTSFTDQLYWRQQGNKDIEAGEFIGTLTNSPLEFRVNDAVGFRILPATGTPNIVGGSDANSVAANVFRATIGGGGFPGFPNSVTGNGGVVAGGVNNTAGVLAVVSGGSSNTATSDRAVVAGGRNNAATGAQAVVSGGDANQASGTSATVSGGDHNVASSNGATVSGGQLHTASAQASSIGGGANNVASGDGSTVGGGSVNVASGTFSTVPGGTQNVAGGAGSFAAGQRAKTNSSGAFVWADGQLKDFTVTGDNGFFARAIGGFYMVLQTTPGGGFSQYCQLTTGSGSWQCFSDRSMKTNFRDVDGEQILARLRDVPIQYWSVKGVEDAPTHIGPMAQDFYAAFGMGDSEKSIATIDLDGVALASVKALDERTMEQQRQIEALQQQLAAGGVAETRAMALASSSEGTSPLVLALAVAAVAALAFVPYLRGRRGAKV